MDRSKDENGLENPGPAKKAYKKPKLVIHGTVAELTKSGGDRARDGLITQAPS